MVHLASSLLEAKPSEGLCFENKRLVVTGRLVRVLRVRSEGFEFIENPRRLIEEAKSAAARADLLTFTQPPSDPVARFEYARGSDLMAVLPIDSYEKWWRSQIKDKTRNMVRKAGKKGVSVELAPFSDELVQRIKAIYDECPVRQGKPSKHFGKDFETVKREHSSFLSRSEFIGAYRAGELVGFLKLVYGDNWACLMNVISLIRERENAPNNALIARAVERCAERGITALAYGVWSRRSFGDFKVHHGFQCRSIPRYYVPLTARGSVALHFGLHRPLRERIPYNCVDWIATVRGLWYSWRPLAK